MNTKYIILGLLLLLGSLSCNKKVSNKSNSLSKKTILAVINNHNFEYEKYSTDANIDIDTDAFNMGISAQIRIVNEGPIWFVGKKFGFEVARGLIQNDTAKVIDRFNKRYTISPIDKLENLSGMENILSYADSYLVGNIIVPDTKKKQIKIGTETSTIDIEKDRVYHYVVNNMDRSLSEMSVLEDDKLLVIKYLNYTKIDGSMVPNKFEITAFENGDQKIKLKINLSNIDLKSQKKMPFDIPKNYTPFNF